MEKQKIEKIILLIILPVFILALVFRFIDRIRQRPSVLPAAVSSVEQKEGYIEKEMKILEGLKSKLKKVEYKAVNLSDPLTDKLSIYIASVGPKVEEMAVGVIEPPQLSITGLIWNTDRPQAIVNGLVLSIGDEIEKARLLSVNKDGIKIEYKGIEFYIKK